MRRVSIYLLYVVCTDIMKDKRIEIRLSDEDYIRLEAYAKQKDVSMAQILRAYIKRLPTPKA